MAHIIQAILIGALLASMIEWLFGGVLVHRFYFRHPEVWRVGNERLRIIAGLSGCLVSAAAFVLLAMKIGQVDPSGALKLAAMIWVIAPLPLLVTNGLFMKLDPVVTFGHAAGWLVKLLAIGATTAWLLP